MTHDPCCWLLAVVAVCVYLCGWSGQIIAEMNRNPQILVYRQDSRLADDFRVNLAFGLHAGWAIEGAVGSTRKIDATYLSPHVNIAARMCSGTKQYGVDVLLSDEFYQILSQAAQSQCRKIDVVTFKGVASAIPIFTYSTNQDQRFTPVTAPIDYPGTTDQYLDTVARDYDPSIWDTDEELCCLRAAFDKPDIVGTFREGLEAYIKGDWSQAKSLLEETDRYMTRLLSLSSSRSSGSRASAYSRSASDWVDRAPSAPSKSGSVSGSLAPGDGPSRTLLAFMAEHGFQAPANWTGARKLTSK